MKKVLIAIRIVIGAIILLSSIGLIIQKHFLKINTNENTLSLVVNSFIAIILLNPKIVYWGKLIALKWIIPIVITIMLLWFSGYSARLKIGDALFRNTKQEHSIANYRQKPVSFKEFLKEKGISLDFSTTNKYETLEKNHNYSNYYFNIAFKLPKNWEIDRGMAPNAIIRAVDKDLARSLALNVIPLGLDSASAIQTTAKFQENPLAYLNSIHNNNYNEVINRQIKSNHIGDIENFKIGNQKIRNINYVVYTHNYYETSASDTVLFKSFTYQTCLWGNLFTFIYTCPALLEIEDVIETTVFSANYTNPYLKAIRNE